MHRSKLKRRVVHALRQFGGGAGGRRNLFSRTTRELLALAWPIATAMGGEVLLGLVDTKLVGGLGASALGGVGVATTLMFLGYAVVFGVMRGVKVCAAHAVGEKRAHDGIRYAQAGVVLGVGVGAAFWACTRDVGPLLGAIGIEESLVDPARVFLATITFGAPGTAIVSALVQHRHAVNDARTPMFVGLAGNVVNALLGWTLIYGHFGAPALGVRGGAIATASVQWLEAIVYLALLARDARGSQRSSVTIARAVRDVSALGVPTGVQFGSETLAFVAFTAVLGTLGPEQIAGHQIALATIRASFLPGVAVSEAASVLVGQALGRRSLRAADRATWAAVRVAVAFMAACGLVFAVAGGVIASAFTDDGAVAHVARTLLWIAAAFQVLDAVNIVLRGALRGAKDVRVPAIIGVAVIWTCVPTAALLLGRLAHWGSAGGWCGFVGETTFSAALFALRWRKGAWRFAYART